MPKPSVSSTAIYQLRVVLCGVSPLVWRRLLVLNETSLAERDPSDCFQLERRTFAPLPYPWQAYGISYLGGIAFREDARRAPLDGRRFPVSVFIVASVSSMNTTSRQIGS
jgi:hypothetical protein